MRALPTNHPSPGYDLILFRQQREKLSAAHVLEHQRQLLPFLTCAEAFLTTQGEFTSIHQIAKEFPASRSLIHLHL